MQIHEAICAMLAEVEPIKKERENKEQHFKFRGIDQVYDAVNPLLAKHKVFSTSEVMSEHYSERASKSGGTLSFAKLKMKYTFWGSDGSSVATEVVGEGMDSADKSCSKAMSIAYKYALFQLLCIPTEALADPDEDKYDIVACPECGKSEHVRKSVKQDEPGFYCWRKIGGCGNQWNPEAKPVRPAEQPPKTTGGTGRKQTEKKTGESAADAISPLSAPRNRMDATSTFAAFKASFANGLAVCGPDDAELDTQWREYGATWLKSHLPSLQLTNREHFDTVKTWIGEHLPDKKMQESVLKLLDAKEKVVLQAA